MYLKKLEICGFKSFADRTKLEFEGGISGIIGPNGCGKSNVADAIRWCLGEQSARSLRSQQMMDVIFGGSQSRATTGMAEVSLTFDNSTNVLPIDYSEVTVTRRLFRSGESEYFINKTQCRLKDIRDMFLDTGIGAEGYAVMEQGKVEFILSAKPEERRELFEEAAGVSKFKARREETLRKLEKVEIDMNRVNDMLAMLKEQINSLDIAAKKARQYQKLHEDLKRMETASLVQKILSANKEVERLRQEIEPSRLEFEKINTHLDQTEATIAQLRVTQIEKDEHYLSIQNELSQVKSGINLADERIKQASLRERELDERTQALNQEIETDTQTIIQYNLETEQIAALRQKLSEQVQALELEYKEKEVRAQTIKSAIAGFNEEETKVKDMLFNLTTERAQMHNEQSRLSSYQARCQAQILSLNKEFTRLSEQRVPIADDVAQKETEISSLTIKKNDSASRREQINARILETELKLSEIISRQSAIKEALAALVSKQQTLQEWEQKDPQRTALHTVESLDITEIRGHLGGLIRIAAGSEDVVAAALGEKLNFVVCDTIDKAQEAISYLEQHNLGRVTFIIRERLPEHNTARPMAEIAGTRPLISLLQYDPEFENVVKFICGSTLLYGKTIYGNAIISGGGQITFDKPVLIDEQLRRIDEDIEKNKSELNIASEEGERLKSELEQVRNEKQEIDGECQRLDIQIEWLGGQFQSQKEKLQYLEKEISLNREELQNHENEDAKTSEQIKTAESSLAELNAQEQSLKERQLNLENEINLRRTEESGLLPLLTEAKVAWATQQNELAGREREEEKLKESTAVLTQRIVQLNEEFSVASTKITEQKEIQKNESDKLKEFCREQESMEHVVAQSIAERQQILQEIEEKNTSLHEMRSQLESIEQKINDYRVDLRSFELQKQSNEQRLTEDHGLVFGEVQQEYAAVVVVEEEIIRLKRRLESMGTVNLAAPEEYANLEERYNFLLTQQQDLLKAKDDLHQVILKINHTTRENFKITFDKIRENFRTLYHQLFEGGEADLILTDESNLLECGVDIAAQPPGKKLQNIALLSGGEKALTAIALLFAFYMVKPSPFCILDEVDAPLDDANVGRYINMIKTFAAQSQFLVITHSKRTMTMADILYGVTMEELGVSKIISVRLQKEKEDAAATA